MGTSQANGGFGSHVPATAGNRDRFFHLVVFTGTAQKGFSPTNLHFDA